MTRRLTSQLMCLAMLLAANHCVTAQQSTSVKKLVIPHQVDTTDHIHFYVVQVLTQALAVTEKEYGPVELVSQEASTVQSRQLRNLKRGISDVVWMTSSTERDVDALPVRIPVVGGLYGYRVLLVKNHMPTPLTLPVLRSMTYTQGPDWPDLDILRANQLTVKPSPYKAGFRLVRDGFIDAYPRAAHEAVLELDNEVGRELMIAPDIALAYTNPLFFYVAESNFVLAERLRQGLTTLIESGELQQLLEAQPFYTSARKVIRGRTIIELDNPYLSLLAKEAMARYLKPSEALSYVTELPHEIVCPQEKPSAQC